MSDHLLYTGTDADGNEFLLTIWTDGTMTVATRPNPAATWGPPTRLLAESLAALAGESA